MHLTIIGSGTVHPSSSRRPPAYLLQQDGNNLLIDAGPGTLTALAGMGIRPGDLDAVILSHLHPDHALDIVHLLFHRSIAGPAEIRENLRLVGPEGFAEELASWMDAIHPGAMDGNEDLEFEELLDGSTTVIGPWKLIGFEVAHRLDAPSNALGYYIESTRGILSYTGDTAYFDELTKLLDRRGCLLCECTSPDRNPIDGHMTPARVRHLAEHNPPQLLVLTHLGPDFDREKLPGPQFEGFPGRVIRAEDGMVIAFDPGFIHTTNS